MPRSRLVMSELGAIAAEGGSDKCGGIFNEPTIGSPRAMKAGSGAPRREVEATMRRLRCRLAVGVLWTSIAMLAISTPVSAADFGAVDSLMLRLMSTNNVPGAALALIKGGKIVLERGYGFRDLATHAPVATTTLFNIGSISKSFTALGFAELVDQHQVDLDTPIIKYVPELRLSDPNTTRAMTLRRLLSHTSGLPPDDQWPQDVPSTRKGIVEEFASMPITAEPGTRFQYCSRCIVLAAYVLERITGESWEAYTRTHIFEPLGMTDATFGPSGLERTADRAQPYRHDAVLGNVPVPWSRLRYLEPLAPAGGIDANIDDMARYALLQLGDGATTGRRVLSLQMATELHRPAIAVGKE